MNKSVIIAKICWLCGGFVFAFFAVGIPWWSIPYDQNGSMLQDIFLFWGFLSVMLAAAAVRIFGRIGFYVTIPLLGASVPAAMLARVVVDVIADPTSHNLWPLEIMAGEVGGVFWASLGALLGGLYVWLTKRS